MTTETWSYFQSQLDRKRKIKAHIVKPNSSVSFCGLQNHEVVGEMTMDQFAELDNDGCNKCWRGYINKLVMPA